MKAKYTVKGAAIHYFVVSFDAAQLPWSKFRGELVGTGARAGGAGEPGQHSGAAVQGLEEVRAGKMPDRQRQLPARLRKRVRGPRRELVERENWIQEDVKEYRHFI